MKLKLDMHIHTKYSQDGFLSPEKIIEVVKRKKLDGVAITDHNEIKGALELKRLAPFQVIVGEEIRTIEGEIIGYFLSEKIPPDLSPEETIKAIRSQGGVVCIPHPFDRLRPSKLKHWAFERIVSNVDIIEAFNARNLFSEANRKAIHFAIDKNLPKTAGSDAHLASEIGNGYIEVESFSEKDDFMKKLGMAKCFGTKTSIFAHGTTICINIWNRKYI